MKTLREPFSGLSHLAGAAAALVGQFFLLGAASWAGMVAVISVLVYGVSLALLFSASAAYHLVNLGPRVTAALRKADHAAIFLLIAGTYTPVCLNAFDGFSRWGLLALVWGFALTGIAIKLLWMGAPRWLSAGIYVLMGWLCLLALPQMLTALSPLALGWLTAGGIIYTLGAVVYSARLFDFWPGRFGFHEVWHLFVLAGAGAHFVAVLQVLQPGGF